MKSDENWHHKAFALFVAMCVIMEVFATGAGALWVLVVIWAIAQYL